jgi:hypothetical protein
MKKRVSRRIKKRKKLYWKAKKDNRKNPLMWTEDGSVKVYSGGKPKPQNFEDTWESPIDT